MSELIKHECGIALVRLLKPLEYYLAKYGTSFYGLNKLHLLMQKQHNRGQDGAGIANIKLDIKPGNKYINRILTIIHIGHVKITCQNQVSGFPVICS